MRVGADMSILLPASLLHDIGRYTYDHALEGAKIARCILKSLGVEEARIKAITASIVTHSFSQGREPITIEAKVLSDADKLDAMGALGIYRAAMYNMTCNRTLEDFVAHFHNKLLKLRKNLYTEEAKFFSKSKHAFMLDFLAQLNIELKPEENTFRIPDKH